MQMLCFIIAIFYKNVNTKNKTKTHNKEHITPKYWYNIYANKSKKFWAAVNKNGFIGMFTEQPSRNIETGKWEGSIYLNSVFYKAIKDLFTKAKFTWEREPEYFEFETKEE